MQGIVNQEEMRVASKLLYYVFFPCLIVSSLGDSVTVETMLSLWPAPAAILLNVVLGFAAGTAVFPFVGMPSHLRPHFISCAGVGAISDDLQMYYVDTWRS